MRTLRRTSLVVFIIVIIAIQMRSTDCDNLSGVSCERTPAFPAMAHYSKLRPDPRAWWKQILNIDNPPFDRSVALLVGVANYERLNKLNFVYNDIREVRNFLLNEEQFSDVYILLDKDIDGNSLKRILVNIFAEKLIKSNDRFLFYYSGHGSPEADGKGHILLSGAIPGLYDPLWDVPVTEIPLWSARLRAKHVLFLLDGCALGLGLPAKAAPGDRLSMISNNGSRIALAATRSDENSYGTRDGQHSVFTAEFLRVLRSGQADPAGDGFTTIDAVSALMQKGLAEAVQGTSVAGTFKPVIPEVLDPNRNGSFPFIVNARILQQDPKAAIQSTKKPLPAKSDLAVAEPPTSASVVSGFSISKFPNENVATMGRPKSFDLDAMDTTLNPCDDFYEYACAGWRRNNLIPVGQLRWGRFNELADYSRLILRGILEKASDGNSNRNPNTQKLGDFYKSCMDESLVEELGASPLKTTFDRIAAITNRIQFVETLSYLQSLGFDVLFRFNSQPDFHNATLAIASIIQGGLGLPDRSYYLNQDPKSQEIRTKYQAHIAKMLGLLVNDHTALNKEAQTVLAIETKLAQAALDRGTLRDPKNRDHRMSLPQLLNLAPNLNFDRFFAAAGVSPLTEVNVIGPDFFRQLNDVIQLFSVEDWRTYLRWHTIHASASNLSQPFVEEDFNFFNKTLSGINELQPRWKRCVHLTDQLLTDPLGQAFVAETFGSEQKERVETMVKMLEASFAKDISQLPWMASETKKKAVAKLNAITNKIGYPPQWRDYSILHILRSDLIGNIQRIQVFNKQHSLSKIGKQIDKDEWGISAPTVNAYYNPSDNSLNFPAGILQPPFFDNNADDSVNFGSIGVIIAHELTHGFDDQGSKFDPRGNLTDWWSDTDRQAFAARSNCFADEYSSFQATDETHLNGRLTLGENTADNGGLWIALMALQDKIAQDSNSGAFLGGAGFTPQQRFFLSFAQIWCENRSDEASRALVTTDQHSPGRFRVNGVLRNSPDFAKAFGCTSHHQMVSQNSCRVW